MDLQKAHAAALELAAATGCHTHKLGASATTINWASILAILVQVLTSILPYLQPAPAPAPTPPVVS